MTDSIKLQKDGVDIDREDAMMLMCYPTPVVKPYPVIENGAFKSPFTESELATIESIKKNPLKMTEFVDKTSL